LCVVSLLAGDGDLHRWRGSEEGRKPLQPPTLFGFHSGTSTHAPPVVVVRGATRRHCSNTILNCFGLFCNFQIV